MITVWSAIKLRKFKSLLSRTWGLGKRVVRRVRLYRQLGRQKTHVLDCGAVIAEANVPLPSAMPDGRPWPKISVITPSFNQGRYIGETIESVLQQGYPNVEHIIVDGASSDETMQVVERYRSHLAHVISETDRGQSDALNKGFRLATGEILCWLNSDDKFAPGALAAVAMAFASQACDVVSGICEIYEDGVLVHRHLSACSDGPLPLADMLDLDSGWNAGQFFYQPEVFFSRAIWEAAGAHVREDCFYSMDYELWCRFAYAGAKLHVIGVPLAHFRMHPDQKTADPAKFKRELVAVRDRFAADRSIPVVPSSRPPVNFGRTLRVAMVNDVGVRYGAGIAHGRLAAGIDMAGHTVEFFDLCSNVRPDGRADEPKVVADVVKFSPDLVIFGNLHSATRDSVDVVEALGSRYPSFWLTHDFWLFTGRCAYPGECTQYLTGCDSGCATAEKYPDLMPEKIKGAWKRKRDLLASRHAPYLIANSVWSAERVSKSNARARPHDGESRIYPVRLGAPGHLFKPLDKGAARRALGIAQDHFVIAFSVSSLAEERKGGHYLIEALKTLSLPDVSVVLIGNIDVPFEVDGVHIVSLGYVTEIATLTAALSAADVYIGPSTEETFGQVFIEAALAGTPSIGFDRTGVRDAIVNGVTGLLVQQSASALRDAIHRLYRDRDYCASMAAWARIHALNEFSLEISYRSLFLVWRQMGLIDRWHLPHKIGFSRKSALVDESLRPVAHWRPVHGVSPSEGPYPQFDLPTKFNWCHGTESRLAFFSLDDGRYSIRLTYYSTIFKTLDIEVKFNNENAGAFTLNRTDPGVANHIEFQAIARAGENIINIHSSATALPDHNEPRMLTFMLKDLEPRRLDPAA